MASSVVRWVPAHPRSRGENFTFLTNLAGRIGSSPLTRGKRLLAPHLGLRLRLIPAHAGKTPSDWEDATGDAAHPRSRGENDCAIHGHGCVSGSSPLTRGKQGRNRTRLKLTRLIPAHAGKTSSSHVTARRTQAHPRSRGENVIGTFVAGFQAGSSPLTRENPSLRTPPIPESGSSPLTRGKLGLRRHVQEHRRLIPAHAGKT